MTFRLRAGRLRAILARWIDILLYAGIGAVLMLLLRPYAAPIVATAVERLAQTGTVNIYALSIAPVVVLCWHLGRRRWRGLLGLHFLFSYPPLWVAPVIGVVAISLYTDWHNGRITVSDLGNVSRLWNTLPSGVRWGAPAVVLISALLAIRHGRSALVSRRRVTTERDPAELMDFDMLVKWLANDEAVDQPGADFFQHREVAQRIATRLGSPEDAPTVAVVGDPGSGKSSIRGLVGHYLEAYPKTRLVAVSLWPFDSPEAAVRGILAAITEELGRSVNTLALSGLPERYVAVIQAGAGRLGSVAPLLTGSAEPCAVLERYTSIACATGLHLVLWIEDLERFSGGDLLPRDERDAREAERLGPIRALLYLLDRSPRISVVVSDTSLQTRFDLNKLARFVEQPPSMCIETVRRIVQTLREGCLDGRRCQDQLIDPASPPIRAAFSVDKLEDVPDAVSHLRKLRTPAIHALACCLRTPRTLKDALRLTLQVWDSIPGEIDFDSVLVASALRSASPRFMAIVEEHVDYFRSDSYAHGVAKWIESELEDRLECESERRRESFFTLLDYLFPSRQIGGRRNDAWLSPPDAAVLLPQALFVSEPVDYWHRYLSQSLGEKELPDQQVLALIETWRTNSTQQHATRLFDPLVLARVRQFVGRFDGHDLCLLLRQLAEELTRQAPAHAPRPDPRIRVLVDMLEARPPDSGELFVSVRDCASWLVPANLSNAVEIVGYFINRKQHRTTLLPPDRQHHLAAMFYDSVGKTFVGEGVLEESEDALTCDASLLRQVVDFRSMDPRASHSDEWRALATRLLDLAGRQAVPWLDVVAALVVDGPDAEKSEEPGTQPSSNEGNGQATFNERRAQVLYGDNRRLLERVQRTPLPDGCAEQIRADCRVLINAARKTLNR